MGSKAETVLKSINKSKASDRQLEIATKNLHRSADNYLSAVRDTDNPRGH